MSWPLVPLKDVGVWYGGGTPSKSNLSFWTDGTVPWLSPKDMGPHTLAGTRDKITDSAVAGSAARRVPAGSVAMVMRSGILEHSFPVAVVPFETTLNQDMKAIVSRPGIEAKWIAFGLRAFEQEILRTTRKAGTTVASIETPRLRDFPLPVPPLEEQQRIVAILDDHLSRLDAATEAARTSLLRLSALRISALTTARNQLVEEGSVMRQLGAVAHTALGKMLDAKRASGSPTPYLRNINVRWGSFDLDDLQEVPLSKDEQERLALQEGDLLVCEGGAPGRCAVWPGSESLVAYQKALHRVRTHDPESVDIHFLAVMLEEFIQAGRADQMFTGTTIKHLPQEKLRLVELPIPTLERQRDVLRSLDSLDEGAALLENELGKVQSRAASLRRALLTAAFTGTLTS